jgi:hypothetical protein
LVVRYLMYNYRKSEHVYNVNLHVRSLRSERGIS